jgi:hypothetical protein
MVQGYGGLIHFKIKQCNEMTIGRDQCWAILIFFCEIQLIMVVTLCYENLIDSLIHIYIYIYIYELVRADQVFKKIIFFKFIQFSNKAVFAYMIIVGFPIQFSQLVFFFWKLIFNFIII